MIFTQPRTPEELEASALSVIDRALALYPKMEMAPLFSGGHDSTAACFIASRHPAFPGKVHHIDTGIGAKAARAHVEAVCLEFGWELVVHKSQRKGDTYEGMVRRDGFPGPASHKWTYIRLKERSVVRLCKGKRVALVTGARSAESTRRMGHTEPVKAGLVRMKKGKRIVESKNRVWTAPCHDWTDEEQWLFMDHHGLPRNPLKEKLGMSGECFCGAFARPNEIELIRAHAPDVAAEIDRLARIAKRLKKHHVWGTRPDRKKGLALVPTGPMCSGCDRRAAAAGVIFGSLFDGIEDEPKEKAS